MMETNKLTIRQQLQALNTINWTMVEFGFGLCGGLRVSIADLLDISDSNEMMSMDISKYIPLFTRHNSLLFGARQVGDGLWWDMTYESNLKRREFVKWMIRMLERQICGKDALSIREQYAIQQKEDIDRALIKYPQIAEIESLIHATFEKGSWFSVAPISTDGMMLQKAIWYFNLLGYKADNFRLFPDKDEVLYQIDIEGKLPYSWRIE